MEIKPSPTGVSGENVLRTGLNTVGIRLTPTGKISHAKTRVYTQRYRKEWEEMPDFKGWLTSVPFQPTRAYCTYCKKNLHAHRLSLLKHTCTMKHQRAALAHEAERQRQESALHGDVKADEESEEADDFEALDNSQMETDENEEDYVVERLDMDEEEIAEATIKAPEHITGGEEEEEEEEEEEDDEEEQEENEMNFPTASDEEDVKPVIRKIKREEMDVCRDTLAEAMAHVHGEYLEETTDQENVQMEMVVESEDQSNSEMNVMSVLPDLEDDEKDGKGSYDSGKSIRRNESKTEKKFAESNKGQDSGLVVACSLPMLGTTYQTNSSVPSSSGSIGVLQPVNTIPITPGQNKTITFTTGGKTLTLMGGTLQPGAQYVLSKVKGKLPTLVMANKKAGNQAQSSLKNSQSKLSQEYDIAGTSQQSPKKHVLLKPVKSVAKKPRISTHVMDMSKGLPIGGLQISLYKLMDGRWTFLNESNTGSNGRCNDLVDNTKINFTAGRYKIHFDVDKYFTLRKIETMYPFIEIVFDVKNPAGHYHIPLLLSPFGYTTYRGSER